MEWSIYFDGDQTPQDGYTHTNVPKDIIANIYSDIVKIETTGVNTGKVVWKAAGSNPTHAAGDLYTPITTIYFHFKVQDAIGNENTSYIPLKLDPQGDIPIIKQVSPTDEILSGIIRFTGTADDDNKIAGLYIEVDPQYNGTTFVPWSSSHKTKKGKSPEDIMTSENYPNNPYELINSKVESSKKKTTTTKAIYIGNGLSWNIALNKYAEWDPSSGNQSVAVRFYATDVDGNMSLASDVYAFQIDSESPKIGSSVPFYLKQYSINNEGTGIVTASMEYTDGMWLKGEWWLEGSVEDESGINSVTMNSGTTGLKTTTTTWTGTKGYTIQYKVGSTAPSAGKLTYALEALDNDSTPKSSKREFIINYDNKAPTLQSSTGDDFNINVNVVNDNGFYMVQSAAEEGSSESGFERAIFYFERTTSRFEAVYDSYIAKGKTGNKLTGLTKDSDGLYWVTKTSSAVSGKNITVPNNANIHKGGLAKFGGVLYKITDISVGASDTVVTLDKTLDETLVGQTISFVIGHVVDHTGTESTGTKAGIITNKDAYGYGYYGNSPDDDGDLMIEKVQTNGTKTVWNGTINSTNIPDGPIEIHYVVFDKAGNSAHGVVTGKVSNNAPRLAGVTVWTDYNGNGKGWRNSGDHVADYESETKSKYYSTVRPMIGGKTTEKSKAVTNKLIVSSNDLGIGDSNGSTKGNAFMKVTDTVKVIPEIVGGNGGLYYQYSVGKQKNDGTLDVKKSGGTTASKLKLLKDDGSTQVNGVDETDDDVTEYDSNTTLNYIDGHTDGVITFTATDILSKIDNSSSEDPTWFDIIIWDSTEGGTPYATTNGTLNCEMQIALNNQYTDTTEPKAYIRPFYWNGKTDNSVAWNGTGDSAKALGHIELEDDLPTKEFKDFYEGVSDRDPKVSGKIKIEGYAFDNIRLKELQVAFNPAATATTGTQAATYSGGTWTGKNGTGWSMTAENVFANSNGHMAHWVLTVDTELIVSTKAAANQIVKVLAIDERGSNGGNKSTFGTSQTQKFVTAAEWGKISAENKAANTYYMDASCTTAVISTAVTDTTVVYLPESYTWSSVKNESGATSTYFTDPTFTNLATSSTANDAKVYKNPMTAYYKMDVVPYITEVCTSLDGAYAANTSVFNRSALGYYPVMRGESIKIKGFNLKNGSTAPTVKINNSAATVSQSSVSEVTFSIPNTNSGNIDITVNGISSLNNLNANTVEGNTEPNGLNNDTLNDDRKVRVWKITAELTDNTPIRYPTFTVGKDENQTVGFVFDYGGADVYAKKNNQFLHIGNCYTQWYDTCISIDTNGELYAGSQNGDCASAGSTSYSSYANYYFFPKASNNYVWGYDRNDEYGKAWENCYNGSVYNSTRVLNPKLKSVVGTNAIKIYSVYYDSTQDVVKFRYGTVGRNNRTVSNALGDYSTSNNGSTIGYQVIAGSGASGNNNIASEGSQTNETRAGEYTALGVFTGSATGLTTNTAAVAWYDASSQRLLYSYNEDPTSTDNVTNWGTNTIVIDSDFAGWYVDMIVDNDGGVHIAYYGASNGDLKYAYLPTYKSTSPQIVTVDSYLSVGTNISIDISSEKKNVTKHNADGSTTTVSRYIPYISYYMSAFTKTKFSNKIAWLTGLNADGTIGQGVDTDKFTGNWEAMIVPTDSVPLDYSIGVGIKKNDGTNNNPILGYGTKTGLETAAMF